MDQKQIQEKYIELQLLDQQIKQTQKHIQLLEQQILELISVKQSLDEVKSIKKGTEVLSQISPGIFAQAEIKDTSELLVNIGANVVVKKDPASAKAMIDSQIQEIEKVHTQMNTELQNLANKGSSLQEEMLKLVENK